MADRPTPFRLYNIANIPEALRMLAHQIEAGDPPAVRCVVAIEFEGGEGDPSVTYRVFGQEPFPALHAIGMCHVAAGMIENAVG